MFMCSRSRNNIVFIHGSPLHNSDTTLSSPPSLDDLSQVLFAFTPSQLPLSSFAIHSIYAYACSLNPQLVKVFGSFEPSLAFPKGLNSSSNSVIDYSKEMTKALWCRSEIQNIDFYQIKIVQVPFLSHEFNGVISFELP